MNLTKARNTIKAVKLANVLLETLEEVSNDSGLGGLPEGHAYMVLSSMLNLDEFQNLLSGLKKVNAIESKHHFITKGSDFTRVLTAYKNLENKWNEALAEARMSV